jgi:hypothetical protein
MKAPAIELQIFRRINAELFDLAQRLGTGRPQRDDQNFGPFILNLVDKIAGFFCAEIHDEQGWPDLLENGIETIGLGDMAHFRGRA